MRTLIAISFSLVASTLLVLLDNTPLANDVGDRSEPLKLSQVVNSAAESNGSIGLIDLQPITNAAPTQALSCYPDKGWNKCVRDCRERWNGCTEVRTEECRKEYNRCKTCCDRYK